MEYRSGYSHLLDARLSHAACRLAVSSQVYLTHSNGESFVCGDANSRSNDYKNIVHISSHSHRESSDRRVDTVVPALRLAEQLVPQRMRQTFEVLQSNHRLYEFCKNQDKTVPREAAVSKQGGFRLKSSFATL
uniref:Uncharacterized protein n=1 Tax=Steinernema glaseri TaxID=37863 RepID=A0A1I7YST3_9BILA